MTDDSSNFNYIEIPEMLVAGYRTPLKTRAELPARFEYLRQVCGNTITGPGIMILRFDTGVTEGFDVEVAFPVSAPYEDDKIKTHTLEAVTAMSYRWIGPKDELSKAWDKVRTYAKSRGMPHGLAPREIYLDDPMGDELNLELQQTFHDWDVRFESSLNEIMGPEVCADIMKGYNEITPHTDAEKRAEWAIGAISKLDQIATEEQKYEVIASCAHVRPSEEIAKLKEVFDKNKDVDEFIEAWGNSLPFIAKPYREGNIIYQSKPPADPNAYETAKTQEEIIKAACFCPIIKAALDKMPRTFCYCGAGWARQMYEAVFGVKLKIDVVETVIDGGKLCKYAIHLPPSLVPNE